MFPPGDRIIATGMQGMAFQDPFNAEHGSLQDSMFHQGFVTVMRTTGIKTAAAGFVRGQGPLIKTDQC
jgi:hypothetical protein